MQLRKADLEAYVRLAAPDEPQEARAEPLARLRDAIGKGERKLADTRIAKSPAGELRASLRLAPVGGDAVVLAGPLLANANADAAAAELLPEVMQRARELGARIVSSRPDEDRVGPMYRAALIEHGFDELGERIEYKTAVADLPFDAGTPLRGRGLGAWVHRRGFRMLREQGGELYHGGTAAANPAMLRLFRRHGCEEIARMLEFEWRAP